MLQFFVRVFAAAEQEQRTAPLRVTFDEAYRRCEQLPGVFLEPDGAFVWCAAPREVVRWRFEGNLYDCGTSLYYVELKGICPRLILEKLLACFRQEAEPLAMEWVERGVVTNEAEFFEQAIRKA